MNIAALGDPAEIGGLALGGVVVHAAMHEDDVRAAWAELTDTAVVILTPRAAAALTGQLDDQDGPFTVVMPP